MSYDRNWTAVEQNLGRARGKWVYLAKILGRERSNRITTGRFYVEVAQSVILFGSNNWLLNPWLDKVLEGFHHRTVL